MGGEQAGQTTPFNLTFALASSVLADCVLDDDDDVLLLLLLVLLLLLLLLLLLVSFLVMPFTRASARA